jgi:hypothetical protein
MFLGALAGCRDSLFMCPSEHIKELRQIAPSLAHTTLLIELILYTK